MIIVDFAIVNRLRGIFFIQIMVVLKLCHNKDVLTDDYSGLRHMDYEGYFQIKFEVSFALENSHNEEMHTVCLC